MEILEVIRGKTKYYTLIDGNHNFIAECAIGEREYMSTPTWFDEVYNRELMPNRIFYIYNFGVKREYRRKGYGRMILEYVINRHRNCFIYLQVSSLEIETNVLVKYYKSFGFKPFFENSNEYYKPMFLIK